LYSFRVRIFTAEVQPFHLIVDGGSRVRRLAAGRVSQSSNVGFGSRPWVVLRNSRLRRARKGHRL